MYCEKCGTKNNMNDEFCSNCGASFKNTNDDEKTEVTKIDTKNGALIIPIVAVFVAIIWPVGFVLSIISTIKYNKLRREEKYKNSAITMLNIIAFFISGFSFFFTIIFVFVFVFAFSLTSKEDDKVFGNYTCYISKYSQIPVVSATFKDKTFSWAKYGDEENNVLMGKYITNKREIKNDTITYELKLTPNYYEADNKVKLNKHYTVTIISNGNDKANISFENGSTYYCDKIGD